MAWLRTARRLSSGMRRAARAIESASSPASAPIDVISLRVRPSSMRLTELEEPASSAAFDRISENSLSVYLFDASLKIEAGADGKTFGVELTWFSPDPRYPIPARPATPGTASQHDAAAAITAHGSRYHGEDRRNTSKVRPADSAYHCTPRRLRRLRLNREPGTRAIPTPFLVSQPRSAGRLGGLVPRRSDVCATCPGQRPPRAVQDRTQRPHRIGCRRP